MRFIEGKYQCESIYWTQVTSITDFNIVVLKLIYEDNRTWEGKY